MPAVLTPLWHVKMQTARTLRERIRAVLEWAIAMEYRADNPCDRVLPVLGPQREVVRHMRALPHRGVAAALEAARAVKTRSQAVKGTHDPARKDADGRGRPGPSRKGCIHLLRDPNQWTGHRSSRSTAARRADDAFQPRHGGSCSGWPRVGRS